MSTARWLDLGRFQAERQLQIESGLIPADRICTLLIPAPLRAKLQAHLIATGISTGAYLRELLKKNRARMLNENWGAHSDFCRRYQEPGLQLCRQNFRVMPVAWFELGVFADFLGISRCFLFVRLIEMDLHGYPENLEGVPTGRLEVYDQFFPRHIESTIRIIRGLHVERKIKLESKEELELPLRFFPFPFPKGLLEAWFTKNSERN